MANDPNNQELIEVRGERETGFSIRNFRSEMRVGEVLSTHSYLVTLAPFSPSSQTAGPALNSFIANQRDTIIMRCESALLPGLNLMTNNDIRRYGYGPVEQVPHGVLFNDMTLTYVVDKYGALPKFFNDWANLIVNHNSYGGADMETETRYGNLEFAPYELGYKDDYANYKMSIYVYDKQNKTVMEYQMFDVFPKAIMDTPIQWGEQDNYIRLAVLFSFTDMQIRNARVTDFNTISDAIPADFELALTSILSKANPF